MPAPVHNVYQSTNDLRWLLRTFGHASLTIHPSTGRTQRTAGDALRSLLNAIVLVTITALNCRVPMFGSTPMVRHALRALAIYMCAVLLAAIAAAGSWQRGRLARLLPAMHACDEQLRRLPLAPSSGALPLAHARHRRAMLAFVCAAVAYNTIIGALMAAGMRWRCAADWDMTALVATTHWFLNLNNAAVTAQYAFALAAVERRMAHVGDLVGAVVVAPTGDDDDSGGGSGAWAQRARSVRQLRAVFARLHDLVDECNALLVWPPMAFAASTFAYALLIGLGLLKLVADGRADWSSVMYVFMSLEWSGYLVAMLLWVVAAGGALTRRSRLVGREVHEALNGLSELGLGEGDRERELCVEALLVFGKQVLDRVAVASCGLFCFDWSLVYSVRSGGNVGSGHVKFWWFDGAYWFYLFVCLQIIAVSATYMMILVQFDQNADSQRADNGTIYPLC